MCLQNNNNNNKIEIDIKFVDNNYGTTTTKSKKMCWQKISNSNIKKHNYNNKQKLCWPPTNKFSVLSTKEQQTPYRVV
jgi:hypothetical protein